MEEEKCTLVTTETETTNEQPKEEQSKDDQQKAQKDVKLPLQAHMPDPTFAAYATNFDITKLSNHKLNVIVAHRSNNQTKFVKCGFCGKYDRLGAYNCSKCNTSLMNNLLNDTENEQHQQKEQQIDDFLDCCDKCMNNFVYGCIYLSVCAVLFVFPLFEIINIAQHWNNYGGCSVYFQYVILSKLLITIFLYTLTGIHIKFKKLSKIFILCVGLLLFFVWLIASSIVFWGDDNFDHDHCNAHDKHTAGYYDFIYIEIMLVYAIFAFIISYFTWTTISKHEKLIGAIVYGNACMVVTCLPTAMPMGEIAMLVIFWDNHGHCSDQFEWYILVKLLFMLLMFIFSICGAFFLKYFKKYTNHKIRCIFINIVIAVLYMFLFIWGIMATGMFFDKEAYDHDMCNHDSMHTAIYYDWMFIEIILNFALLYLGGNVILCLIFAGYLCGKSKQNRTQIEQETETELQRI